VEMAVREGRRLSGGIHGYSRVIVVDRFVICDRRFVIGSSE